MSSVLQTVNKLRFYRKSDISNKARFLLSRWSKLFVKGHVKKSATNNVEKKRDDLLQLKVDTEENNHLRCENSLNIRELESKQVLKLLPGPDDNSCRKQKLIISPPKNKVRRKVLLMEHSELTNVCKSLPPQKAPAASTSRPLSVDDIQKAKMRAAFMQNKSAKTNLVYDEKYSRNLAAPKKAFDLQGKDPSQLLHTPLSSRGDDVRKPTTAKAANSAHLCESLHKSDGINSILSWPEKLENLRLCWKKPPAIQINSSWAVGSGENSKEIEVQTVRNKREKEVLYFSNGEIPDNPREPWDREMDFDDSLTPGIPIEQPPDTTPESAAARVGSHHPTSMEPVDDNDAPVVPPITLSNAANNITTMPDLELLAVLLNNPDLVFALTSGQGNGLTDSERFALLDTLKKHGSGLIGAAGAPGGIFSENHQCNLSFEAGSSQLNGHIQQPVLGTGQPLLPCHPVGGRDGLTSSLAGISSEASTVSVCAPQNAGVPSSSLGQVPYTTSSTSDLTIGFKSTLQSVNANLFPPNSTRHASLGICATDHVSYRESVPLPTPFQTIDSLNHHVREVCDSRQTPNCDLQNVSTMYSAPPVALNWSSQEWHFAQAPAHVPFDLPTVTHLRGSSPPGYTVSVSSDRRRGMWVNGNLHVDNREHATYLHGNQNGHIGFPSNSILQMYDDSEYEDWSFGRSPMRRADGRQYRSERGDDWKSRFNRSQPGSSEHRSYNNRRGRR